MSNQELTFDQLSEVSAGTSRPWCGTCSGNFPRMPWIFDNKTGKIIVQKPGKKNPPEKTSQGRSVSR